MAAYDAGMIPVSVQAWGMRRLDGLAARLGRGRGGPAHLAAGVRGEREALYHLRRRGYTVVARRWTSPKVRGDVDLIGWQGDVLCFVEVKSRTARDAMAAETAVDREKRTQLRWLARAYLKAFDERQREEIAVRFDVVSVYLLAGGVEFEVLENAFGWAEHMGDGW